MRPFGRDIRRSNLREVLPPSRRWHPRSRALLGVFITALTIFGWVWVALAAEALWSLASTLPSLLAASTNWRDGAAASLPAGPVDLDATGSHLARPTGRSLPPAEPLLDVVARSATISPRHTLEERAERAAPLALPPSPEFHGAICKGVFVYIVTVAENAPSRSAVSFATSETAQANLARPGERVGGWELLAITDDWTGANPVVWLLRDDEVCRTGLTGNPARVKAILQQEQRERLAQRARQRQRRQRQRQRRQRQRRRR